MQVMSSSAVALQLLGANSGQPAYQAKTNPAEMFRQAATRYVEATPELTGVYTDPRAEETAKPSLAQRVIDAMQKILSTDVVDFKAQAKAGLESALGRPLGENEKFSDLGSYTRAGLPKDVLRANRSVEAIDFSFGLAMSRAKEINLDRIYSLQISAGAQNLGRPEELQGLDMSKTEDRQKAVDFAIRLQTRINSAGINLAESNDVASDMMSKSLGNAGVGNLADLNDSYAELHRSRFENGEFTVIFDGVEITNATL